VVVELMRGVEEGVVFMEVAFRELLVRERPAEWWGLRVAGAAS
jgi:hypothetical protein